MAKSAGSSSGESKPAPLDWLIFAALVAVGGSSFAFIKEAVATIPPPVVAVGRLWIGGLVLYAVMRAGGEKLPPFFGGDSGPAWAAMLGVSLIGYAAPFLIFPWAQQYVESGLAGVYMAFMPLWTIGLAHYFADERLTRAKAAGFALGFLGVVVLMGGDALAGAAKASLAAQAGLVLATFCYAVSVVISRRTPQVSPKTFACATVLGGALFATPALCFADYEFGEWSPLSLASVVILGLGPTALAGLLIIVLVQRVCAGFMAFANYLTPVWAVILGAAIFQERLQWTVFLALGVVLAGVAVSRAPRG